MPSKKILSKQDNKRLLLLINSLTTKKKTCSDKLKASKRKWDFTVKPEWNHL